MCRYSREVYKTHYACLPCRFTAKYDRPYPCPPEVGPYRCPHCRERLIDLGRDFHAPRRRDMNQWRKIELLVSKGVLFDSCGCTGPGHRPATWSDAKGELGSRRSDRKCWA